MSHVEHDRMLTTREVARLAGVSHRTAQGWRCRGYGPAYLRLGPGGKVVRYRESEVLAWLRAHTTTPLDEKGGRDA